MDRTITTTVDAAPASVITALADLGTYPEWLDLVHDVRPLDDPNTDTPVWDVTLRARLGPLARSKRLRMRRTLLDDRRVRFDRDEIDGRDHASWVLEADVADAADGSDVRVNLHYGGSLWSAPIEAALAAAEGTAARRLSSWLAQRAAGG